MQSYESSFAALVLQWATGLYPPEKREWGEAILAESYEVTGAGPKLWWTLGGLNMAVRAFLSNLLSFGPKHPGLDGPQGSIAPIPWKRVLGCVAIAMALLLVPGFRQGLSLVVYSWRGYRAPQIAQWQEMGREAENNGDADTMAYAAMRLPVKDAFPIAQRAVAKDPSLTWVYCFIHDNNWPTSPESRARRLELLAALSKWDPDNATPYLAIAANTSDQSGAYKDPKWLDAMSHAMAAKSYDSYFARRLELQRRVNRLPSTHDLLGNLVGYWVQMPSVAMLNEYAAFLQNQSEEAGNAEARAQAASQLWLLANLGSLIHVKALSFGERYDASEMREVAFAHLQPVLVKLGEAQEAQAVGYAAQIEAQERARSMPYGILDDPFLSVAAVSAHLLTLTMLACFLMLALGVFIFAMRGATSRFARHVLTYTPIVLLATSAAFLVASYPYERASKAFLDNPLGFDSILRLGSLSLAPVVNINWYLFPKDLYTWWSVIVLGSAVCMWMGFRALRHRV